MESSPAVPGGSLTSKPTWSITCGWSATSVFLLPCGGVNPSRSPVMFAFDPLKKASKTMSIEFIILIVVLVLLFGGGGGYYWSRGRR